MKRGKKRAAGFVFAIAFLLGGCKVAETTVVSRTDETEHSSALTTEIQIQDGKTELTESEVVLPWQEGETASGFIMREDGKFLIYSNNGKRCVSKDEGISWKEETDVESAEWLKKHDENENTVNRTIINAKGYELNCHISYENEELNLETMNGEQTIAYRYKTPEGEITEGSINFSPDKYTSMLMSEEGKVFLSMPKDKTYQTTSIYEFDAKSMEKALLVETEYTVNTLIKGNQIIFIRDDGAKFFDYERREWGKPSDILDSFIKSKRGNILMTDGEDNAVYMLCEDGLYRYLLGGSSIEQISDGKKNAISTLGDLNLITMGMIQKGIFYFSQSDGKLYRYQDGAIKKGSEKTLKIFRLREEIYNSISVNEDIKAAIAKYEKLHPELEIELEVGMPYTMEESAVTNEDVMKNLNMELSAGKGPDILLLDDLPADSYIEKGILADISDVVNTVNEKEGLLPQILKHYIEEDGSIYRIPLGFKTNVLWGPKEILEKSKTLDGFAEMIREENKWDRESLIFLLSASCGISGYMETLAPSCMGTWINADGQVNAEELSEFFKQTKIIAKTYEDNIEASPAVYSYQEEKAKTPNLTVTEWIKQTEGGTEAIATYFSQKNSNMVDPGFLGFGAFAVCGVGEIGSEIGDSYAPNANTVSEKMKDMTLDFTVFLGQQEKNVFNPKRIIAINQNGENSKEAKEFLEFLLSQQSDFGVGKIEAGQTQSWKQRPLFSINKIVTEKDMASYAAYSDPDNNRSSEEQITRIRSMIETLEAPSISNPLLLQTVMEEGVKVLWGDKTPEEAAKEVKKRMEIYLAE